MLQQLDGPRWREKIPRIPSLSSFSQFTSPPSRAVPEKAPPKIDNTAEFEKCKTSGNSFFAQVGFVLRHSKFRVNSITRSNIQIVYAAK